MASPGYAPNSLKIPQHTPIVSPKHSPHHHTGFKYCTPGILQYAIEPDETPILSKKDTTLVRSILGSFLYYGRFLDGTIIPALNEIILQQYKTTQQKNKISKINRLSSSISRCIQPIPN